MTDELTLTVKDVAEQGYGVFHAMPSFHPDENSPITRDGQAVRTRIIAGLNPDLSTSSFKEGVPAIGRTFGDSTVSLLASNGSITTASTSDYGTTVSIDGVRQSGTRKAPPNQTEVAEALRATVPRHDDPFGRAPGYNELTVANFSPAGVVVNLDRLLAREMATSHVEVGAGSQESTLAKVQSALKGDISSASDRFGGKPLSRQEFWGRTVRSAVFALERAHKEAAVTETARLPVYALVGGRLHKFEGFSSGRNTVMAEASRQSGKDIASAGKIEWAEALEKNTGLLNQISGPDKALFERLSPFVRLAPEPTPLGQALANAPVLSQQEKAAIVYSILPAFKPEYESIPAKKFEQLAPTEPEKQNARAAFHSLPVINGEPVAYTRTSIYRTENGNSSNLSVYGPGHDAHARAIHDVERANKPMLDLMQQKGSANERIIPESIYAAGLGLLESNGKSGFSTSFQASPTSQQLFDLTQERLSKFGRDGVIVVETDLAVRAASPRAQGDISTPPKEKLAQHIDESMARIERREQQKQIVVKENIYISYPSISTTGGVLPTPAETTSTVTTGRSLSPLAESTNRAVAGLGIVGAIGGVVGGVGDEKAAKSLLTDGMARLIGPRRQQRDYSSLKSQAPAKPQTTQIATTNKTTKSSPAP